MEYALPSEVLRPEMVAKHDKHWAVMQPTLEAYSKVGRRDLSLYDWLLFMFENISFSSVDKKYFDSLAIVKTKFTVLDVLYDDLVDFHIYRNANLFNQMMKIPTSPKDINTSLLTSLQQQYLLTTKHIYLDILSTLVAYPRFEEFYPILKFDIAQTLNAMHYAFIANSYPNAANTIESSVYDHHSMLIVIQGMLDLMCSLDFDSSELRHIRKLLYLSQEHGKIGNIYNTYTREIGDGDYSSEPIIYLIETQGMDIEQIRALAKKNAGRIPEYDELLRLKWKKIYGDMLKIAPAVHSIDVNKYLQERIFIQNKYIEKVDHW